MMPASSPINSRVVDETDVFVSESESDYTGGFPYLDVVTKIGGGVSSEKVLSSFEMCGGSSRVGKLLGSGKYTHMINYCKLTYCPDCSREGGPIESVRKGRVFNHIDIDQVNIRGIVYT
jgi:hypothetical protein